MADPLSFRVPLLGASARNTPSPGLSGGRVFLATLLAVCFAAALTGAPLTAPAAEPAANAKSTAEPAASVKTAAKSSAETIKIRTWPHKGYGRIVFDWPKAVEYRVKLTNRALKITFARPFAADAGEIAAKLSSYAARTRIDDDGKSLIVTLKPGVRFKSFDSGKSVVVDLLSAEKDKKAVVRSAGAPPSVPIRIGLHETYSRLVFDWPRAVEYKLVRSGNRTLVRFSATGRFDLKALKSDMPPFIGDIAAGTASGGSEIALTLRPGASLRHFRSGLGVVVDVMRPDRAVPPKVAPKAKKPAKTAAGKTAVNRQPVVNDGPVAVFDMQGKAVNTLARQAVKRLTAEPARVVAAPTPLLPATASQPVQSAVPVFLNLDADPPTATIKFHWPEDVGAAVFERAGYLWAVFDREARFAFEGWDEALAKPSPNSKRRPEEKPAKAFIARPLFSAMPGTSVFRMRIPQGVNPRVSRDHSAWVIVLEREYLKPAAGVDVESHLAAASGARLFISYPDAGQAVAAQDPEVGDRIWVAPLAKPEKGIGLARHYAEVQLFATAQGIAGRAVSDDIVFRTLPQGIEIASRAGLTLSGVSLQAGRGTDLKASAKATTNGRTRPGWLFDFESWKRADSGTFMENKHRLQLAAAMAPPTSRNPARLELAQLFFAHHYLTDVLGLLQVIEQDEPELAQSPGFRALRGASYYQLGDLDRAARDIDHPSLDSYREIALWRAGIAARLHDWVTASRYFTRSESVMQVYPRALRIQFGLLAAETALTIGDVGLAKFHLDTIAKLGRDGHDRAAIDYLRGQLLAKVLDPEGAIAAWTRAKEGPDRRIRVLATLARTDLMLERGKMTKRQAIGELEKLRFAWRGDALEFRVLHRIGKAYLDDDDYKNGLLTLRELATYFPKNPETGKVIDSMRSAFVKLYVDGEADKISPLTALALYDQFRELTPEGPVGDKLIVRLSERLVAVDLLGRAATLLRHLVNQRLTGTDRLEAANKLALVYLLDRKPQEALDTLAGQVPANLIPRSAIARRHLKARAFADLARYKEGLALIAKDDSVDAERLRSEIYWKLRDWPKAALSFEQLIAMTVKDGVKGPGGAPVLALLTPDDRRNILSLAITYALSHNQVALNDVRMRFLGRMAKSPFKASFDVVTAPSGIVPDDYRAITSKVAEVDQFRSFIKSYRDQLLTQGKGRRNGKPVAKAPPGASAAPAQGAEG